MKDAILKLAEALKLNPLATAAIALLVAACVISWRAAVAFTKLTNAIERSWSYNMERESWDKFSILNPTAQIPDVEKIRHDHMAENYMKTQGSLITKR